MAYKDNNNSDWGITSPVNLNLEGQNFPDKTSSNKEETGIITGKESDLDRMQRLLNSTTNLNKNITNKPFRQAEWDQGIAYGDAKIDRVDTFLAETTSKINNLQDQLQAALDTGDYNQAEKIGAKLKSLSEKTDKGVAKAVKGGADLDFLGGGITALQEAPNIYRNLSTKPTSKKEATSQDISTGVSGAKIGFQLGGPVGAVAGFLGGHMASRATNVGWVEDEREKKEEIALEKMNKEQQELIDLDIRSTKLDRLRATDNLMRRSAGYTERNT